jgi:hypothetical protein
MAMETAIEGIEADNNSINNIDISDDYFSIFKKSIDKNQSSSLRVLQNTPRCNIQVIHDTKNDYSIKNMDESVSKSKSLRQALGIDISNK